MFSPSPAVLPARREGVPDPRLTDLLADHAGDAILAGVPYDVSVLGRKGAKAGPTGIREAFRFISNHDPRDDSSLIGMQVQDFGDVAGLDACGDDVLAAHELVRKAIGALWGNGPAVLLGGDHGLTFPHVQSLCDDTQGAVGMVVIDAHYDLRQYDKQPSSGTPFRRILTELGGRVAAANLVEVGIRPYANDAGLGRYAREQGVTCITADDVRERGMAEIAKQTLEIAGDGVEHLWMSVDIDGFDQSIASGCSAPGAGGLLFHEGEALVRAVASDERCRAMDVLEVAPTLDPTGNTCRTAAQLVASFLGATRARA